MGKQLSIAMPPITSYPFIADLLAILWSNRPETEPWIFNRYIQLHIEPNHEEPILDFYDGGVRENDLLPSYFCPFIEWRRIDRARNFPSITSFVDYVKHQIDHNTYIDTPLDQYYLRCSQNYLNNHNIHETLIYGYDNIKKEVYVSDFYDKGRFAFKNISFYELEQSADGLSNFINLYSLVSYKYAFRIDLVITFLEDFIFSRDSFAKYVFSYEERNKDMVFGLDIFDYLTDVMNKRAYLNRQAYHVLYDHALMMKFRIIYLKSIGIIKDDEYFCLLANNDSIIEKTLILRNMSLKFNFTHEKELLDKINNECVNLKNMECLLIKELLQLFKVDRL